MCDCNCNCCCCGWSSSTPSKGGGGWIALWLFLLLFLIPGVNILLLCAVVALWQWILGALALWTAVRVVGWFYRDAYARSPRGIAEARERGRDAARNALASDCPDVAEYDRRLREAGLA
jgi:hypothetical protein